MAGDPSFPSTGEPPEPQGLPGGAQPPAAGEPPNETPPSPSFGDFFWLGTGCAIAIVAGGAIGYGLDTALGTQPWLTFGGLAFGVISAVLLAVSQVRKFL